MTVGIENPKNYFLLHFESIARVFVLRNEVKDICLGQFLGSGLYLFHSISSGIVCINKLHDYDERICSLSNGCRGNRKKTLQWLLRGEINLKDTHCQLKTDLI